MTAEGRPQRMAIPAHRVLPGTPPLRRSMCSAGMAAVCRGGHNTWGPSISHHCSPAGQRSETTCAVASAPVLVGQGVYAQAVAGELAALPEPGAGGACRGGPPAEAPEHNRGQSRWAGGTTHRCGPRPACCLLPSNIKPRAKRQWGRGTHHRRVHGLDAEQGGSSPPGKNKKDRSARRSDCYVPPGPWSGCRAPTPGTRREQWRHTGPAAGGK